MNAVPIRSCFVDIQGEVIALLSTAESRIQAAISWLTDEKIINTLMGIAARQTVFVEIIINDDDINRKSNVLLGLLQSAGVRIHYFDPTMGLMHHKFCLIDDNFLIAGSYNWTYSAANRNEESILIIDGDDALISHFSDEFRQIKSKMGIVDAGLPSLNAEFLEYRTQIFYLDTEISKLSTEIAENEFVISEFETLLKKSVGDLVLKKLYLEKILHEIIAKLTRKQEDNEKLTEKEDVLREYEESLEKAIRQEIPKTDPETEQEMKKIFRECMMMIHPDRYADDPEKEDEANQIAAALNDAYKKKDFEKLQQIHEDLNNGIAFKSEWIASNDLAMLMKIIEKLKNRRQMLIDELDSLRSHFVWRVRDKYGSYEDYFEFLKKEIQSNIASLENELNTKKK